MSSPSRLPASRRAAAVAVGTVTFLAVLIAGFGMTSLLLNEDVIETPGLGQAPGAVAVAGSVIALAVSLWLTVGRVGAILTVVLASLAAFLGYILLLALAVALTGSGLGAALGATARAATSWPGLVVAIGAALSAVLAVAVAAGAGTTARWPWEGDDDEE